MTKKELLQNIGGISKTSKMPCGSWSLSARWCKVGSKLNLVKGSACFDCYALGGYYIMYEKTILKAYERNLKAFNSDIESFTTSFIEYLERFEKSGFFRWFDSGDLQSTSMLEDIIIIAIRTPSIKHWIATREYNIVSTLKKEGAWIPNNLVIRLSHDHVDELDADSIPYYVNQSTVISDKSTKLTPKQFTCPSSLQDGQCLDCRACWNSRVKNVAYIEH